MKLVVTLFLVLSISITSYAQSFSWVGSINGVGTWTYLPINVSGIGTLGTCPNMSLESVSIQFPGVDARDFAIYLRSPNGTTVPLSWGNGGYWNEYGITVGGISTAFACFDMRAANPVLGTLDNPIIGEYIPESDLNTNYNNGQSADGTWDLIVGNALATWFGIHMREAILTFGDCTDPTISPCYTPVLPIDLLSFTGEAQNQYNLLNWSTASEINNDYFVVENSNDGATFKELTIVAGGGNSNSTIEYSYQHFRPSTTEYYRLKQVDFDGQFEYSKIVAVSSNGHFDLVIFPNPSKGNLSFSVNEGSDNMYTVRYTDVLGKVIEETVIISQGANTYQLKGFEDLGAGIYAVQIFNRAQKILTSQKIVRQ